MGCGASSVKTISVLPYPKEARAPPLKPYPNEVPVKRTDSDLSSIRTARAVEVGVKPRDVGQPGQRPSVIGDYDITSPSSPSLRQAWSPNEVGSPRAPYGRKTLPAIVPHTNGSSRTALDVSNRADDSLSLRSWQDPSEQRSASPMPTHGAVFVPQANGDKGTALEVSNRADDSLSLRSWQDPSEQRPPSPRSIYGAGFVPQTNGGSGTVLEVSNRVDDSYSLKSWQDRREQRPASPRPTHGILAVKPFRESNSEVSENNTGEMDKSIDDAKDESPLEMEPFGAKKLKRGMSKTLDNMFLVDTARNVVLSDIKESSFDHTNYFVDTPEFTFMLPDLTVYSEDFRAFLEKDLIETSTLVSLEQAGRLNWWADIGACQRLLPLATSGDGNCLLHAASLGMWGFHDRLLTLRKALFNTMSNGEHHGAIWRRWRWQQILFNREAELVYSETEWQNEWLSVLQLASTKPRSTPGRKNSCCDSPATRGGMERLSEEDNPLYESLEEIHVFVLAHVLRRPIIVVADVMLKDSNGEPLAPIPFGGIYLPMECNPKDCHRSPLVLTYDAAHFSALVAMEVETSPDVKPRLPAVIPLVDPDFKVLPLHFDADPGQHFNWDKDEENPEKTRGLYLTSEQKLALLERYMDVSRVTIPKHDIENLGNSKESVNTNDSDECKSSSGSCESEDSVGNKEKSKVTKQMNTVAKQFGSIGKTMSKKLKKNFGGITKAMKSVTGSETPQMRTRRPSISGSQTQSTNLCLTVEMLKDKEHILCAKLSNKRAKYQEEMIKNYLHSAHERFEYDRDMKRKRGSELKMKVEQKRLSRETVRGAPVQCIMPGCNMFGTDETSYLCSSCYSRQKQEALNFQNSQAVHKDTKTNLVTIASSGNSVNTTGHAGPVGRSKFFAGTKDPTVLRKEPYAQTSNNLNNQVSSQNDTLHLRNSTFYDGSRSPDMRRSMPPDVGVQKLPPISTGNVLQTPQRSSTPQSSPRVVRAQQQMQGDGMAATVVHTNPDTGRAQSWQGVSAQSAPLTGYDNLDMQMSSQCNIVKPSSHTTSHVVASEEKQYCRNPGCQFYGSEQFNYMCSGCYKVKMQQNPAAVETTYSRQTRL